MAGKILRKIFQGNYLILAGFLGLFFIHPAQGGTPGKSFESFEPEVMTLTPTVGTHTGSIIQTEPGGEILFADARAQLQYHPQSGESVESARQKNEQLKAQQKIDQEANKVPLNYPSLGQPGPHPPPLEDLDAGAGGAQETPSKINIIPPP